MQGTYASPPLSGRVVRIAPQSSCVVGNLVLAAKPQEPLDDTKRHLFTITFAIAVPVHRVIEWASKEKDESLGPFTPTLVISERTVRTHVSNILNKFHLANRTQAALYALREGLADLES